MLYAEAASSPAGALLTDRFSLNGDMSRTDFIADHTLRPCLPAIGRSSPAQRCPGSRSGKAVREIDTNARAERFSLSIGLGTVRLMLPIPSTRLRRYTAENSSGTTHSGLPDDG